MKSRRRIAFSLAYSGVITAGICDRRNGVRETGCTAAATSGLMQRSKPASYSITSSASCWRWAGTSRPTTPARESCAVASCRLGECRTGPAKSLSRSLMPPKEAARELLRRRAARTNLIAFRDVDLDQSESPASRSPSTNNSIILAFNGAVLRTVSKEKFGLASRIFCNTARPSFVAFSFASAAA
jgi:hypothetical protein